MFIEFLQKTIKYGKIEIIDYDKKRYVLGSSGEFCVIRLHKKNIIKKIFINPELYVGEAYVDGDLTIEEGSLEIFINIMTKNYKNFDKIFFHKIRKIFKKMFSFLNKKNLISTSIKNVAHHYDINEEIYKLFLDKDMQYSCAYFHNDNISLDQAQIDKKHHLIKKMNIDKKNMRILDIGSGWGGMALQIAKDTGAYVKGITLSKKQLETSRKRAKQNNLSSLVNFELEDYRNINEKFDRIISIGMFEHVGIKQYDVFFKKIKDILTDDGVMVLHSIGQKYKPEETNPWIKKYIFPGGYIPSLSEVFSATEKEGLWINDLEIWRLHYASTLKHWRKNFNNNREKISQTLNEKFCRMWEFYLLLSEYSFRNMGNFVFQMQISKNLESLPFTRNYIYN